MVTGEILLKKSLLMLRRVLVLLDSEYLTSGQIKYRTYTQTRTPLRAYVGIIQQYSVMRDRVSQ